MDKDKRNDMVKEWAGFGAFKWLPPHLTRYLIPVRFIKQWLPLREGKSYLAMSPGTEELSFKTLMVIKLAITLPLLCSFIRGIIEENILGKVKKKLFTRM